MLFLYPKIDKRSDIDVSKKLVETINRTGLCLDTDNELVYRALMSRCYQLERKLKLGNLTPNEQLMVQDEYERTFALTGKYRRN